ncbi:hypothetical protein N657DRAFT_674900 [Parathielavia appendiculata]|uniref:Uncharacterized protein n=1 Tax=Parathielavia appendiculata TaxID=2587402 RepID=A0AAN6YZK2_9PEZI|nr:hypothetical protein N657DRAFT_674900 [Parathielavia appendiculata]
MSVTFEPMPSLDLVKPTRVKVQIPLDLLAHFDPIVDLSGKKVHHLARETESVARVIAEKLSMTLFGSTKSLPDPFIHWLKSYQDGPAESVCFTLSHEIAHDGLNPVYLIVRAKLAENKVVFGVEQVEGELRQTLNYRHEVEEANLRRSMMQQPEGEEVAEAVD